MQLPPLVKEKQLDKEAGLSKSLFYKLIHKGVPTIMLDEQFRVPTQICDLYRDVYVKNLPTRLHLDKLLDIRPDKRQSLHIIRCAGKMTNE